MDWPVDWKSLASLECFKTHSTQLLPSGIAHLRAPRSSQHTILSSEFVTETPELLFEEHLKCGAISRSDESRPRGRGSNSSSPPHAYALLARFQIQRRLVFIKSRCIQESYDAKRTSAGHLLLPHSDLATPLLAWLRSGHADRPHELGGNQRQSINLASPSKVQSIMSIGRWSKLCSFALLAQKRPFQSSNGDPNRRLAWPRTGH